MLDGWQAYSRKIKPREFPNGLAVKDPTLSLLCLEFSPWPGNFHMPQAQSKKKKKKKKKKERKHK